MALTNAELAEIERQKYVKVYGSVKYASHSPHWRCYERIRAEIAPYATYANFGCGSGLLDQKILADFPDIRGHLVDHVKVLWEDVATNPRITFYEASLFGQIPSFSAEFGVSTDVMEHIPPEMVDTVLDNIKQRVERAFFQISLDPTSQRKADNYGGHLHLTVEEPDWWLAKLRKHFSRTVTPQTVTHQSEMKKGWLAVTAVR
jgi:hypothetical protein